MKFFKKLGLAITGLFGFASVANAAIAVDSATGAVTGTLELAPFYSGAAVIMTALASIIVIRWVMGLLRRG